MPSIGNIQLPEFPLLLAPMEDVSDPPFRAVCKDKGADLMYTEFMMLSRAAKSSIFSIMRSRLAFRYLAEMKKALHLPQE
jgi:tRNA-dihydrouridine synthase B